MPRRSGVNEAPDPVSLFPTTRECTHPRGGIVRFFDGVPIVVGIDKNPNKVDAIKRYLEREVILAKKAKDAERANKAKKWLEDIRNSCLSWYKESESWGKESFQIARTDIMILEERGSLEQLFWGDLREGQKTIGKIYGLS
jgi:hypothetical protein